MTRCTFDFPGIVSALEDYANGPASLLLPPSWEAEKAEAIMPQLVNPHCLTPAEAKRTGRVHSVSAWFVAVKKGGLLVWKFYDLRITDLTARRPRS